LAFIEKFAWSTQNHGVDLPEIYIQDPVSGVRYELEGMLQDVRDRSVLVLNVEALDEVKRAFEEGLGGVKRGVEGLRGVVEEQQALLLGVSEAQRAAVKEWAAVPRGGASTPARTASGKFERGGAGMGSAAQMEEIRSLRRDLAVVRQTYTAFVADMQTSMSTLRSKAETVKSTAAETADPTTEANAGRARVDKGKKTLAEDSEKIVNRVDDLQDVVEDLRKDVVLRGVRPLPRQLETVSKEISVATAELKKLQSFLKEAKEAWTRIWERELRVVCDERELLTMQEELVMDLEDDLEKAGKTFGLVEMATRQQNLGAAGTGGKEGAGGSVGAGGRHSGDGAGQQRSGSRTLRPVGGTADGDPEKARDGVLGEVRALRPNHESRLEAIERAERARRRELESRKGGAFQQELGAFVDDGRLKKSGGVEEVERVRKAREERTRREVHENLLARERAKVEKQQQQPVNGEPREVNGGSEGSGSLHSLEVPGARDPVEREGSPEPVFVEAPEVSNGGGTPSSSSTSATDGGA
ncbi:Bud site selection protein 6, partial [Teratosphaeriaceae sp. CCFEE 6253]